MPAHRDQSEDRAGPPPEAGPARAAPPAVRAEVPRWQLRLPAVLETLGLVRTGLRRWLALLEWPEDAALDILLAVNEAVSNSVEHAFPPAGSPDGTVEVAAEVEDGDRVEGGRRLRVHVRDTGRWLPRPDLEPYVNRRRGLPMMVAVMAEVRIHRGGPEPGDGTVVTLLSPPVPGP
ncbi:ATP-binding protein [Pseudonocardia yuanmonensis]|uniref:ATP-binding protein n=1 Tax=Pseudonocardia yuanmonensis TaxID=1095914 RepID=UPI0031E4F5A4